MNKEQKTKLAMELFKNTSMTKEQYEEFKYLCRDLDLTIVDVHKYESIQDWLKS